MNGAPANSPAGSGQQYIREDLLGCGAASNLQFNEEVKALQASGRKIFHFAFGQSPFPVPHCLTEALKQHAHRHEYLSVKGIPELRQGIVDFHRKEDSLQLNPENIIVAPGSKQLIYLTMAVFNGVVIVPAPAWTTYAPQVRLAGRQSVVVPADQRTGLKLTPQTLEGVAKTHSTQNKLLIFTNPGNPSGVCYSEKELQQLVAVCRQYDILVLSDEIYARLAFYGQHYSIAKLYPEGTILTTGFSKWASAGGWRLGYAHFPAHLSALLESVSAASSQTHSCAPAPMQLAAAQVLRSNYEELLEYMTLCRRILCAVGTFCHRELQSAGVGGLASESGYYFMPDFAPLKERLHQKGITTGKQMTDSMLKDANVALMASSNFLMPENDFSTRLCFVCFDGATAYKALKADTNKKWSSAENGSSKLYGDLNEAFIREYCKPVVEGVEALRKWCLQL